MSEKKEEAVELLNNSNGFFLLSTKEVNDTTTELSVVLEEIAPSELAQGIDWLLQTYPEIIEHTLFGSPKELLGEKPSLVRMN